MCGQDNPRGLGLDFTATDDGEVSAVFRGQPALQGYPDILHGGIISALHEAFHKLREALFGRQGDRKSVV